MKIVIVGGGTAGWCCASYLSMVRPQHSYVIIDHSGTPTIGVGEATTGMFTGLIDQLGIDRWDFMRHSDSLPKLAIRFENWRGDGQSYLHPIDSSYSSSCDLDYMVYHSVATGTALEATSRLASLAGWGFSNVAWSEERSELYQMGSMTWIIDPVKTRDILREASFRQGVQQLDAKVLDVQLQGNHIQSVITDQGPEEADIFIDCTGQQRLLSRAMGVAWRDYSDRLPVNRAMTFRPSSESSDRTPWVTSTAMPQGWLWAAPTRHRVGRGYLYSDQFTDSVSIQAELRGLWGDSVEILRDIPFQCGVLERHAQGNAVFLGMSSGFLEPMKATSIHSTLVQLNDWVQSCLTGSKDTSCDPRVIAEYNRRCQRLDRDMMEFVAVHYCTDRSDTEFWRWVSQEMPRPDRVTEILELAERRLLRLDDFDQYLGSAGAPLWIYSLAGLGKFDPKVCEDLLREYGYNWDHIQGQKELNLQEILKHRDNLLTQTELNQYFLNTEAVSTQHPNLEIKSR